MAERTIKCGECKKEFTYTYNPRFKRKFCPACSAARKKDWEENRHLLTFDEAVD